jgi:hypothetical protein
VVIGSRVEEIVDNRSSTFAAAVKGPGIAKLVPGLHWAMRRRRLHRMIALPLALWFVALATDVGGIDACPMHDAMAHAAASMHMAGMPGMSAAAGRMAAPGGPAAPPADGPVHCTCMGLCCGCAMATLPTGPAFHLAAMIVLRHGVQIERARRAFAVAAPHLLPPAIGPPALHSV